MILGVIALSYCAGLALSTLEAAVKGFGPAWLLTVNQAAIGLTAMGCALALVGVCLSPVYYLGTLCTTLRSWKENRILEELTCTGLTNNQIVDQMLAHTLKRWFLLNYPAAVAGSLLFLTYGHREAVTTLAVFYPLFTVALLLGGFSIYCWKIAGGSKGGLIAVLPAILVAAVPLGVNEALVNVSGPTLQSAGRILLLLYVIVVSHKLARLALSSGDSIGDALARVSRMFVVKRSPGSVLPENAITARQEMVGRSFTDLFSLLSLTAFSLLGLWAALTTGTSYPLYAFLLFGGFLSAGRAAGIMSQIVTEEREQKNLETLRTTPLGSGRFLNGWLRVVLQPMLTEIGVFTGLLLPMIVALEGPRSLTSGHFFLCAGTAVALPLLGALFGASIAAQCKPRQEVNGQVNLTLLLCFLFTAPQISVILALDNCWVPLFLSAPFLWLLCWLFRAGAEKSLNRVFLPQN